MVLISVFSLRKPFALRKEWWIYHIASYNNACVLNDCPIVLQRILAEILGFALHVALWHYTQHIVDLHSLCDP